MAAEEHNWNEEWQGLEPEQPQAGRCGCWVGASILLLALLATCVGTGLFAWRQLDLPLNPITALGGSELPPLATAPAIDDPLVGGVESEPAATLAPLVATVTLSSGEVAEPSDRVEAQQMTIPPQINGDLSEWGDQPRTQSAYRVFNDESWDRSDDVDASWQLAWDNGALYVAVRVQDDTHVQTQSGDSIFRGDGVSLQLDTDRTADLGTSLSRDDFQINLSPGDFANNPSAAFRFRGSTDGSLVNSPGHRILLAAAQSADGYVIEAAIPWSDLGVAPQAGLELGVALNVNDNDTPDTAVQEVMKSHVATRQFSDPSSWGILVLR